MNIQIIIWLIIFIYYLSHRKGEYERETISGIVKFGCFFLILESGFRHIAVGNDTTGYYWDFYYAMTSDWDNVLAGLFVDKTEFRDPGYLIVTKLFSTLIPSWQLYILASAIFYYYAFGKLMCKYCNSCTSAFLGLTLILALFNIITLSGARQMISMSISMFIIEPIMKNEWKKYLPLIAIGSLIHISCLFCLLFIPLSFVDFKWRRTLHLVSIIAFPIVAIFARNVVAFLASFSENDYYKSYAMNENYGGTYVYSAIVLFLSIFIYFKSDKVGINIPKGADFLQPAAILMTLTAPLIIQDGSMIRISQYFTIYLTITVGNTVDSSSYKSIEYLVMFPFLIYYIALSEFKYYFFWQFIPGFEYNHPFWGI